MSPSPLSSPSLLSFSPSQIRSWSPSQVHQCYTQVSLRLHSGFSQVTLRLHRKHTDFHCRLAMPQKPMDASKKVKESQLKTVNHIGPTSTVWNLEYACISIHISRRLKSIKKIKTLPKKMFLIIFWELRLFRIVCALLDCFFFQCSNCSYSSFNWYTIR